MGIYAETDFEISCENATSAKKVKQKLNTMKVDKLGNFNLDKVKQSGEMVYGKHSSNRIQNLEWQCEEIWERIKKIKGVQEANFPFLTEADGVWFENKIKK